MFKISKPSFWNDRKSIFPILLFPITFLVLCFLVIKRKIVKSKKFNTPIICVGNIYLGGTGKTPLAIEIVKSLIDNKKKPALVKKYYKNQLDEQNQIRNSLDCMILNKSRIKAVEEAEHKKFDLIVLDDGYQDLSFKKDMNIICFSSNQSIGNGFVIPSGPLRENLNTLKKADVVLINGEKNLFLEEKIKKISDKIEIFYSKYSLLNLEKFRNKKLVAFAGIGNPENFFELLKKNNLNLQKCFKFPDHYHFSKKELKMILDYGEKSGCEIVTTEKDYFRIKNYGFSNIGCIKIKLNIEQKNKFINKVLNFL